MLFNSFNFIVFFVLVTTLYFIIPHKIRWVLLLIASYIFYMAWEPELIILIVFSTWINYIISHKIYKCKDAEKRRKYLILSVVINFGLLFVFKYLVFINNSFQGFFEALGFIYPIKEFDIILPMGISFYTFQVAAYTIDVYRGEIKPVKNYGVFSLFITFFPQLVAGPIERSKNLIPQFYEKHKFDFDRALMGLKIMAWGFFKKVVIADRVSVAVNTVYGSVHYYSGLSFILVTILFTFQIYCDFSGYSDIATGCAKVMGFRLMRNFDRPFIAKSIQEFWRRWHISLSSWFTDYIYIPLGGNREGLLKKYRNTIITFLTSGIWHGANWTFVIWGGLHGLLIVLGDITKGIRGKIKGALGYKENIVVTGAMNLISMVITFSLIVLTFVIFRANSIGDAKYIISHIFWGFKQWLDPMYLYQTVTSFGVSLYELIIMVVSIIILMVVEIIGGDDFHESFMKINGLVRTAFYSGIVSLILIWGVFYNAGEFIYFQF